MSLVNTRTSTRRIGRLMAAAAPAVILMAMAAPALAQSTNAGTIFSTASNSAGATNVTGATGNTGGVDTTNITLGNSRTILNWNSFNLAAGDRLNFVFGGSSDIVLNRVLNGVGTVSGQIFGTVGSTAGALGGNVWFLSQDGMLINSTASINAGGILFGTGAITDGGFFAGNYNFSSASNGITVAAGATLNAASGAVTLVAPSISFSGSAVASGSIALIGARDATVVFDGDLDAYVAISTSADSGGQAGSVSVGQQASFNAASAAAGGKTYLIAAGTTGTLGSIVLGGTAADRVEFVEGDVVLYAASDFTNSQNIVSGGVVQSVGGGNGDITIGAMNVSAGSLNAITTDDLTVNDAVTASGSARFEAGDMLDIRTSVQTGGDYTIRADDFTGGFAFAPTFTGGAGVGDFNIEDTAFGLTLGGLTAPNDFRITTENGNLSIVGAITATTGNIVLTTTGANTQLSLGGNLVDVGGNNNVTLNSGGTIVQPGGTITAGTLNIAAMGSANLGQTNAVTFLGASSANGLTLLDAGGLSVSGALNGGAGGINLTTLGDLTVGAALSATNGPILLSAQGANSDIVLNAAVNAGTGTVALSTTGAAGTITQNASGAITAGVLMGGSMGVTALGAANNNIANLGGFSANGLTLADIGGLTVSGAISGGASGVSLTTSGDLNVNAALSSTNGPIALTATGANADIGLNAAVNAGTGAVTLTANGANGTIGQNSSGVITAGALSGASNGATTLTAANNQVSTLAGFAANGLSLNDSGGLTVAGAVAGGASGVSLTTSGALSVGGVGGISSSNGPITLSGAEIEFFSDLNAGAGAVSLTASAGSILQRGTGIITAGTLSGAATGSIDLDEVEHNVGAIGNLSAGQNIWLRDLGGLTVGGTVSGQNLVLFTSGSMIVNGAVTASSGNIGLIAGGADLSLNAAVSAASGTVSLLANSGAIGQTTLGVVTANTLVGGSGGVTNLSGATNQIAALGAFDANGFSLSDAGGLTVSGAVNGGAGGVIIGTSGDLNVNAGLSATNGPISLTATGANSDVMLSSTVIAGTGAVTLASAAASISQTAGGITAGTLNASAGTTLDLGAVAANNNIAQLGAVTAGSAFSYRDVNGFTVAGPIAGSGDVTLIAETGNMGLAGNVTGQTVSLNVSSGALTQTAGVITANTLTGFVSLAATLDGANQIANLGGLTANSLSLNDLGGLTVTGASGPGAGGGDVSIRTSGGPLTIAASGSVAGGAVVLSTDGAFINQSGSDAVTAGSKWTIYAASPDTSSFDGLNSGNTAIWNGTLATRPASGLTGNRYVFVQQPTLTVTTLGANKTYGTDLTASGSGLFSVSGYHAGVAGAFLGDTAATAFSGAPVISSSGFAERASVAGGPYAVSAALGTLASGSGYAFAFDNAGLIVVSPLALGANVMANNKTYDRTTTATGSVSLTGVLSGDAVGTTAGTFAFADRNAGTGKTVNVSGVSLTGADSGNYTVSIPASVLADIFQRALTANVTANNKTYDGTTAATGAVTLNGVISGDAVGTTAGTFTFASRNAGAGQAVNVGGVSLTGDDAGNYTVSIPTSVLADIFQRALTANVSASNKTYDGTTAATGAVTLNGVISGDAVGTTAGTFTFADRNAGAGRTVNVSGISLTGADAGNYTVNIPTSALADIFQRALTANVTANNKTYDGTTAATGNVSLNGVISGDAVGTTAGTFTFADRNAGVGKTINVSGVSLTGADAGNYTVSIPTSVLAGIFQRALTANVTANNKTYDGTTAGSGSVSLNGVISGDAVGTTAGTFTFASRNAGIGQAVNVNGVSLTGADAGNYTVSIPTSVVADILMRALTANVTANNKTYDGTTAATGNVSLNGVISGDAVGTTAGTFTFADRNAGTGRTVNVSGVSLTGADAGNYTVNIPTSVLADILQRALTVNVAANNKTYDGTTAATGTVTVNGVLGGDAVGTTAGTFTFANQNAGAGRTVNVSGVSLTGADAGNYAVTIPTSVLADILQRAITVAANNQNKQAGAPDPTLTWTISVGSLVAGDFLTGSLGRTPGEAPGAYSILQDSLAASANYNVTYVPGTLNIQPGPAAPVVPLLPVVPDPLTSLVRIAGPTDQELKDEPVIAFEEPECEPDDAGCEVGGGG